MQTGMMTENRAELLSVQSWINWKVVCNFLWFTVHVNTPPHPPTTIFPWCIVLLPRRKGTDSPAGGFEPAHQAAPEVQQWLVYRYEIIVCELLTVVGIIVLTHSPPFVCSTVTVFLVQWRNAACVFVFFLSRKDPSAFFSFPVTDLIAPGYSSIIKRPMDFSTMKDKVKKECYQSLDELKVSVCVYTLYSVHTH